MKTDLGGAMLTVWAATAISAYGAGGELKTVKGCALEAVDWADGDSFRVVFPNGDKHTIRLYAVDCFEKNVRGATDERRLRAQRRYFGISNFGGGFQPSIAKAKTLGAEAAREVQALLTEPFTVTTAFSDARGDPRFERVYGFVTTADGKDLGELLVGRGLARAYGVCRDKSPAISKEEYQGHLADLELRAAKKGTGAWAFTDWESLPDERFDERQDEAKLALAIRGPGLPPNSVDPNTASRDLLMELPGVGETLANRIIEGREDGAYETPEDLLRVSGIGGKTLERMRPMLKFDP